MKQKSPWTWVPTLYIAEGLPAVVVMTIASVVYMHMGLSDTQIAFYTGWLGLPWVYKPLWSPFVDIIRTKRWWVLAMQLLLGSSLAGVAFTINTSFWLQATLCCFFLMAFSSATHDIAADGFYMIALDEGQQSWFVGIRNTFYRLATIFGKGVLVPVAGVLQNLFPGQNAFAWSLVFYGLAGLFIALWLYHSAMMPKVETTPENQETHLSDVWEGLKKMLFSFFHKMPAGRMIGAICFLLLYRFPEAMLTKMTDLFLLRPNSEGGLGMTAEQYGLANGVVGLVGLLLGGIIGGILVNRYGLKKCLWPLVCAITLPDIVYVYMSYTLPTSFWLISILLFVEQFGYGLGFTALTLYMLFFSQGQYKTSHYSICTGLSYLGLMLPGMASGWLKDSVGYPMFFTLVMAFCLITFIVTAFIKVDADFGKTKTK